MVEVEFLTVAEFAARAGVSKQNIYKQVHNSKSRLAPYILRRGKGHIIKATALKELYGVETTYTNEVNPAEGEEPTITTQEAEKPTQQDGETTPINQEEQPKPTVSTQESQPLSTDYILFLKEQIAELKTDKDETEKRLSATIQEKDKIIAEQSAQLAELAKQVADIANRALITTSQQQYLSAAEKAEKQGTTEQEPIEEKKKGFFKRLFS